MNSFAEKGYTIVKGFLDLEETVRISKYLENCVNRKACSTRTGEENITDQPSRFYYYADPLIELILEEKTKEIEEIVNLPLYPTYSFMRVYVDSDALRKHTDRPECEYSVTVHVAKVGKDWPICIKDIHGNDNKIILNISPSAVMNFLVDNATIEFSAKFSGVEKFISFPVSSVLAIYSRENGSGMIFAP